MQTLIIDNNDSFTFNLSQLVAKVAGREPLVIGNRERGWRRIAEERNVEAIILSPGPGTPERRDDFGIGLEVVRTTELPLLGVCLGHQGIGHAYGASVVPAPAPMHGRISRVEHDASALFHGLPASFDVVRYHSLCLRRDTIPACLRVTAWTPDGVAMALSHVDRPQFGVQFHPESILAECGEQLIRNFLGFKRGRRMQAAPLPQARPKPAEADGPPSRVAFRALDRWVNPQDAFERLFLRSSHAFWLDSADAAPGSPGFSFMGDASGPDSAALRYSHRDRTLRTERGGRVRDERVGALVPEIRKRLARPVRRDDSLPFDFQTGLAGYFGYELRGEFGAPGTRAAKLPDAALLDVDRCIAFDHAERRTYLVARTGEPGAEAERWFDRVERALAGPGPAPYAPQADGAPVTVTLADDPDQYFRKIRQCQSELLAGESYQICLTSEFQARTDAPPYDVYRALRTLNPAPYAAYLQFPDFAVLSSSPERFLRIGSGRRIAAGPIKGTCPRGAGPAEDAVLAAWLRTDEKSRSENLMIVDLLRNDIGRVAETASVQVPELMGVETYATVHQLVSTVTGRLRPDRDGLDCLAAAFPGGSMTGAPKLRTMAILDRLEERARGVYSGALGYCSYGDRADLSIVIRTLVMADSEVTVGAGGAIVAMSDPRAEFDEMVLKARAPLRALAAASAGDADAWTLRFTTS